jgi:DNA-binding CsgD family transcriptional regulator
VNDIKPLPDYPGYYITTRGEIISVRQGRAKLRKLYINRNGYLTVPVSKPDGKMTTRPYHRLLAQVWLPNPDSLPVVNHKDANKLNNNLSNLEWCTHEHNNHHAEALGLVPHACGEDGNTALLTNIQAAAIREMREKYTTKELARIFNISRPAVYHCLQNRTYSDVWGKSVAELVLEAEMEKPAE